MKKNKKQKRNLVISICLIAVVAIGGAFAFLTSTDSKKNQFTIGKIDIEFLENFDVNDDGKLEGTDEVELTGGTYIGVSADNGSIIANNTILNESYVVNTGNNAAYVFIKVDIPRASVRTSATSEPAMTDLYTFTVNTGWIQVAEEGTGETDTTHSLVFAYATDENTLTKLDTDSETPKLYDSITFVNYYSTDSDGEAVTSDLASESLSLELNAYAVQTDALTETTVAGIWGMFGETPSITSDKLS